MQQVTKFERTPRETSATELNKLLLTIILTVLTQFEDLNLVNADATDETKLCHDKICPWILSRTIVILSASTNRPYESFAIKGNQPDLSGARKIKRRFRSARKFTLVV